MILEKYIAVTYKDEQGNTILALPYTKVENVDGAVSETELVNVLADYVAKSDIPSKFITSIGVNGNKLICYFNDSTTEEFELYKTGANAPAWK